MFFPEKIPFVDVGTVPLTTSFKEEVIEFDRILGSNI
jgi:hypothetical protein